MSYKLFPPRWRHLLLPTGARGAAKATLALWSPCRGPALALQRVAWFVITTLGVRALPGPTGPWQRPVDGDAWSRLESAWRDAVGDFDAIGIYAQPQKMRTGMALLLCQRGRPVAFVKLRRDDDGGARPALQHEHDVLHVIARAGVTAFRHPHPVALGSEYGWTYLLTTVVGSGLDRPARGPTQPILEAVREALTELPRDPGVPEAWEPMHGDLTPWNLRTDGHGCTTLVDWEDAGWGPPGADAVLLHATRHLLFGEPVPTMPREATEFWLNRTQARPSDPLDDRTRQELLGTLRLILETAEGP